MFFGLTAIQSFIFIVAIFIVVYWMMPKKLNWVPFLLITVLLAVLAYHLEPNETDDLARYFDTLDYLRAGGRDALETCYEMHWNHWHIYRACSWYFYLISKFSNNHYLSAVTIFIVYGLMLLVLYNTSKFFNVSKFDTFLGSVFFLSTYWFYDTASGIRNGMAFAIVFACAFYHLLLRKNVLLCIVGYVLACLFHSASIMPVVFVILAVLTMNNAGKFFNFILLFGIIGGGAGIQFLASISDNDFIQSIAGKAESNGLQDTLYTATFYVTNITTLAFVVLVVVYYSFYLFKGIHGNELKRFYKFCSMIVYFNIGSLYSPLIFMRFARWIMPIIGAFVFMVGRHDQQYSIDEKTASYLQFYSGIGERVRYRTKDLMVIVYIAYCLIHFWYLYAGSSITWMHF